MTVLYDIDFIPEEVKTKLPTFFKKIFDQNLYSKKDTNYAQVVWDLTKEKLVLSVFSKDDFPLDYQTFSGKNI